MRKLLLFAVMLISVSLYGQRLPNQFTEEVTPDSSNFEVYSQKSGLPRRANLFNLKKYFDQDIYILNDTTFCLSNSNGDTCLSLSYFVQSLSVVGDSLSISNGNKLAISDIIVSTDDQNLSLSGDTLTIEDGSAVDLGYFRQTIDSIFITGDSLFVSVSDDNVKARGLLIDDLISAGTADGNGIKDNTTGLPNATNVIDANLNSFYIDSLTIFRMMALNHILTRGVSTVATFASNRLSNPHNGFIHQDGLGTYVNYTDGTYGSTLKLFGNDISLGVTTQANGLNGPKLLISDTEIYNVYRSTLGSIQARASLTAANWRVTGPRSGTDDQNYIRVLFVDSTLTLFDKYKLPNTYPTYSSNVILVDNSGNATWGQASTVAYDDLTSGSVTASITRLGGTSTTISTPGAGVYDLDIKSGSELEEVDMYGDSGDLDGSNQFTITLDNSANSRDKRYIVQLYDGGTGALVDQQATGTNHTQTVSGNITTLVFPNMNGFASFRILLR